MKLICEGVTKGICNGKQSNGYTCRPSVDHRKEVCCNEGLCAKYYSAKEKCSCIETKTTIYGIDEIEGE